MNDKKSKWERLVDLPQEYERNPEIVKSVIRELEEEEKKAPKKNWFSSHWKPFVVALASCVVAVAIALPVYASLTKPQTIYYEYAQVALDGISDINAFMQEKGLNICYYDYPMAKNQFGVIAESREDAYLMQDIIYMDDNGFDRLNMKAIVLQNAEFDFETNFILPSHNITIQTISVDYSVETDDIQSRSFIFAKFSYENVRYYLEIETKGDAETKIEQYVTMLLA